MHEMRFLLKITHPNFDDETEAILFTRCLCTPWTTDMPPKFELPEDENRRECYIKWWNSSPVSGDLTRSDIVDLELMCCVIGARWTAMITMRWNHLWVVYRMLFSANPNLRNHRIIEHQ